MCSGRSRGRTACSRDGASSTITCAFVPLNPNALTPATRGELPAGHGWADAGMCTGAPFQLMCGFSSWKFRCAGISSFER